MKTYIFEELLDRNFGKIGTPRRDAFEREVRQAWIRYYSGRKRSKRTMFAQ